MKFYYTHFNDTDGDLWNIAQDVKRLDDTLSSYNLGLTFVDKATRTPIELDFNVDLIGEVEGNYNEQRADSSPKEPYGRCAPGTDGLCC